MKNVRNEFILLMVSMVLSACSPQSPDAPAATAHSPAAEHTGGPVHWGCGEDDGPASWAALSSDYATCASGREQSPIDIAAITTDDQVR